MNAPTQHAAMRLCPTPPRRTRLRSAKALPLMALAAALLSSCGGGNQGANSMAANTGGGIGSGGTGSYTVGSISGFGSIVVNGVRYSYTSDKVSTADGSALSQLQFGMVVEITGSVPSTDAKGLISADASAVKVGSVLVGPIGSVDLPSGSFKVLGQTVQTSPNTFYDAGNTLRLAKVGALGCEYVRVHGFLRAKTLGGGYNATRVECLDSTPDTLRLRGVVEGVASRTLTIGGTPFAMANDLSMPPVGTVIRATVIRRSGTPAWTITHWGQDTRPAPSTKEARLEGIASAVNADAGTFVINDTSVQTNADTVFQGLTLRTLTSTKSVSVHGRIDQNGLLLATEVEAEDSYDSEDEDDDEGTRSIQLYGSASQVSQLTDASFVFTVSGGVPVTVYYTTNVFDDSAPADLLRARHIQIEGVRARDGSGITATSIELEDD
jgi:Domain of unknown function (DUF5666)